MSSSFSKAAGSYRPPRRSHPPEPPAPERALLGSTIAGKYRLVRTLGYGGMGAVYKAENIGIGKVVAIKLLHRNLTEDTVAMQRFQREARATVAIAHPNIVEVLDMGQDESGSPYLVMEYVRGTSLKNLLRQEGPIPVERAAWIGGQIADALAAAHRRGVIHRDLKPENVLVSDQRGQRDVVTVVDFGISTFIDAMAQHERDLDLTPTGLTMATPFYASPEQIRGAKGRDPRVDLYALGVMLYELLAGYRPFQADNLADLCQRILESEVAPLRVFRNDVPPEFEAIVQKALDRRIEARFQTGHELALALVPWGGPPPRVEHDEPTDTFTLDVRRLAAVEQAAMIAAPSYVTAARAPNEVHEELSRGLLEAFVAQRGREAVDAALAPLDPALRQKLGSKACDGATLAEVLVQLDRVLGRGDLAEVARAGRAFARRALSQRGGMPRSTTPELFFSLSAELWPHYFGLGEARVSSVGRGYGRLEVRCPTRPPLALTLVMLGLLDEGLRCAGGNAVSVRLDQATARGDLLDAFEATWS